MEKVETHTFAELEKPPIMTDWQWLSLCETRTWALDVSVSAAGEASRRGTDVNEMFIVLRWC